MKIIYQLRLTHILLGGILFFLGCQHNSNGSQNSNDMLYKLYVVTNKVPADEAKGLVLFKDFKTLYAEYDVKVIGVWVNTENPYEIYFMTAFRDDNHYKSFVESMKSNEDYQRMSKVLEGERESVESVNLRMSDL